MYLCRCYLYVVFLDDFVCSLNSHELDDSNVLNVDDSHVNVGCIMLLASMSKSEYEDFKVVNRRRFKCF